eukprot:jgi/Botrbrau1/11074/Bobra.0302s0016.1
MAFTPFDNQNCPRGFIVGTDGGLMRVCQLPPTVRLDTCWPLQRIPLRSSAHALAYYPEAGLYAVLTSRQVVYKPWLEEEGGGDPSASYAYAAFEAGAKQRGVCECAEVRLVQPGNWSTVWRYDLQQEEEATAVGAVHLRKQGTGASQPLVAVGTSFGAGEDYPCTGRILLFEIKRGEKQDGQSEAPWAAEMVYQRELRGPVTHVGHMKGGDLEGVFLVAYGFRVETYQWTGSRLQRIAFYDAPELVTSVAVIKSYLVIGDVHKGLIFLQASNGGRQLTELGREFDNRDIWSCGFLVSGARLMMVAGDGGASVRLFTYDQEHPDSWKGKRLIPLGAMHLGYKVTRWVRASVKTPAHAPPKWKPFGGVGGCNSGALVGITPLWTNFSAASFVKLQRALTLALPQPAGLNPIAFRKRHRKVPRGLGGGEAWAASHTPDTVLDLHLLSQYFYLGFSEQVQLAASVELDRATVLGGLRDLSRAVAFW